MSKEIHIEKAILSSIFSDRASLKEVFKMIKPNDFYLPSHKEIFKAMIELSNEEMPIDESFLNQKLQNKIKKEDLLEIFNTSPAVNLESFTKDLKEQSNKREIKRISILLNQLSTNEDISSAQILSNIEEEITKITNESSLNFLEAQPLSEIKEEDTEYICKSFIPFPKNSVTLISALGGTGKTWAIIQAAKHIIEENSKAKVLLITSEDRKGKIKARANKLGINENNIHVSDILPFDTLQKDYKTGTWKQTEEFYKFKNEGKKYDAIFIDPLLSFYSGDENSNGDAKKFMIQYINFASKEGVTIIFLHHSPKDGKGSRGAGAFADASRLAYTVDIERDKDGKPVIFSNKLHFCIQKENDNIAVIIKTDKHGGFLREIFPKNKNTILLKKINRSSTSKLDDFELK